MKNKLLLSGTILGIFLWASVASAKNLSVFLDYAAFYSPSSGSYLETYINISSKNVVFTKTGTDKFQGTIEITLIFSQNGKVSNFRKINLKSPEITDTSNTDFNFIDVQRILLPSGGYEMEISIADSNSTEKPLNLIDSVFITLSPTELSISDIQFLDSYKPSTENKTNVKNGYELIPKPGAFYPATINKLIYTCEFYNAALALGENEKYIINTYIEGFESKTPLENFYKTKKETAKPVSVAISEFDITKLPSGNYFLVNEIRDKTNKTLATSKRYFIRSNPVEDSYGNNVKNITITNTFAEKITSIDTLTEFIYCLNPISAEIERLTAKGIINSGNITDMQKYFYGFWYTRNKLAPEKSWKDYKYQVDKISLLFATQVKKGYETDRGRVYLQYGAPNSISESHFEPSAYPYEIWHYYQAGTQRNKRFVFYNRDLASKEFQLVHSDVTGEISDYGWKYTVYGRNNTTHDLDATEIKPSYGNKANQYYKNPR